MKVLIISHNPITTYGNMGKTMASLFSEFKKEELCQLYIYPTIPDIDFCNSYYRITDIDVLKSYFKFKVKGREILKKEIEPTKHELFENAKDEQAYNSKKNKTPQRMLLRDLMWKCSRWYNRELKRWIEKEKPTSIFIAPGSAKFIYDVALKISKEYNLPIVVNIVDDFFFVKRPKKALAKIQQKLLKNKICRLMKRTRHIISICDEITELYSSRFNVPATTIMTGSNYQISKAPKNCEHPTTIRYFGNIGCNRFVSLCEIGEALDDINSVKNTNYSLEIFTSEKDEKLLAVFEGIKSIKLCGFVSGKEFDEKFHSSEILLHTEAFDEASIDLVKHSVSTKIADSLGSGICLFAYGPAQVASIKHLMKNNCAVMAVSKEELEKKLLSLFQDKELREETILNELNAAQKLHYSKNNSEKLYRIMEC